MAFIAMLQQNERPAEFGAPFPPVIPTMRQLVAIFEFGLGIG
jgi:hypothetical protein